MMHVVGSFLELLGAMMEGVKTNYMPANVKLECSYHPQAAVITALHLLPFMDVNWTAVKEKRGQWMKECKKKKE